MSELTKEQREAFEREWDAYCKQRSHIFVRRHDDAQAMFAAGIAQQAAESAQRVNGPTPPIPFTVLQANIAETAKRKGWHPDYSVEAVKKMPAEEISALLIRLRKEEVLVLVHTEVSEAVEAIRHREPPSDHISEFSLMEEELADVVIRVMHIAEEFGYRVWEAMLTKCEFNKGREFKHGGKQC